MLWMLWMFLDQQLAARLGHGYREAWAASSNLPLCRGNDQQAVSTVDPPKCLAVSSKFPNHLRSWENTWSHNIIIDIKISSKNRWCGSFMILHDPFPSLQTTAAGLPWRSGSWHDGSFWWPDSRKQVLEGQMQDLSPDITRYHEISRDMTWDGPWDWCDMRPNGLPRIPMWSKTMTRFISHHILLTIITLQYVITSHIFPSHVSITLYMSSISNHIKNVITSKKITHFSITENLGSFRPPNKCGTFPTNLPMFSSRTPGGFASIETAVGTGSRCHTAVTRASPGNNRYKVTYK